MKKARAGLVALVAAVGLTGAFAGTASAALAIATHPTDQSVGQSDAGPHGIRACDREVDGRRARVHHVNNIGDPPVMSPFWAPSGGCSDWLTVSGNWGYFRICVEDEGCGGWFYEGGGSAALTPPTPSAEPAAAAPAG